MDKDELIDFFKANRFCHLATLEDGAPRVRGLNICRADENGILIQTWRSKDLNRQLERNPAVELCFNNNEAGIQIRVRGEVEPVEDAAEEEQVLAARPFLKKYVDEGQELALYRLKKGLAHVWTMAKNFAPKEFIEF